MNNISSVNSCRILLQIVGLLAFGCSRSDQIAGGSGSTTTNGFSATVRDDQNRAVAGAAVRVRPSDYYAGTTTLAESGQERSAIDTVTGADGRVTVGSLTPGDYTIEVQNTTSTQGALLKGSISNGPVTDFGIQHLAPNGTITGVVDSTLLVNGTLFSARVYGLERNAAVDSATGKYTITAVPPGTYTIRLASADTTITYSTYDTVTVEPGDTVSTDPFAVWPHRAELTFDATSARLQTGDTIINFPLLLRLTRDNFDFATAKKKGGDFRAVKEDGTFAAIDADWWDSTNAIAVIWIRIDTVYGSNPVKKLNIYWGNNKILSVSRPNEVFDTSFGYNGVWHLNESGGTAQKDATVNHRDGIPRGMDGNNDIPGLIGRAQRFDGDSCRIDFPGSTDALSDNTTADVALSAWVKTPSSSGFVHYLTSFTATASGLVFDGSSNRWRWFGAALSDTLSAPATIDGWTHIFMRKQGASVYFYCNGVPVDSAAILPSLTSNIFTGPFTLGASPASIGWFAGVVDEMRMHHRTIPEAWIRLCYETQREGAQAIRLRQIR